MLRRLAAIFLATLFVTLHAQTEDFLLPKREFRGAWMSTIWQPQYARMSSEETQAYLIAQLDSLKAAGCNAVIFQVRPQSDALYASEIEPWSKHLTGRAGRAPEPFWDPLEFIIAQAHARGMELHAWLNPYRVTISRTEVPPKGHIYHSHPERFIRFDGLLYFDPGQPENRDYITSIVTDIVTRYDVDGIHLDDYFYPYPKPKLQFADAKSFATYGNGMSRNDWRRKNVNLLIEQLHHAIKDTKPWVRFGVSPFGIWRNKANDERGSETHGLQNYDDLYADVLLWSHNGWVDYLMPQLYWSLNHGSAPSGILAQWWNDNAEGRHVYFGQDVERTMKASSYYPDGELEAKMQLERSLPAVQGHCWWPAYSVTSNHKGISHLLASEFQRTIALPPAYDWISTDAPAPVRNLRVESNIDGEQVLMWDAPDAFNAIEEAWAYVIYCVTDNAEVDTEMAENIIALTGETQLLLREIPQSSTGIITIAVSALSRTNVEGPASTLSLQ